MRLGSIWTSHSQKERLYVYFLYFPCKLLSDICQCSVWTTENKLRLQQEIKQNKEEPKCAFHSYHNSLKIKVTWVHPCLHPDPLRHWLTESFWFVLFVAARPPRGSQMWFRLSPQFPLYICVSAHSSKLNLFRVLTDDCGFRWCNKSLKTYTKCALLPQLDIFSFEVFRPLGTLSGVLPVDSDICWLYFSAVSSAAFTYPL